MIRVYEHRHCHTCFDFFHDKFVCVACGFSACDYTLTLFTAHRSMGLDENNVHSLFEKAMYLADIVIPQVGLLLSMFCPLPSTLINTE